MSVIGRCVRWRHRNPDGTLVKDVDGTVEATALSTANKFWLLVLCKDGRFATEEAADLEVYGPEIPSERYKIAPDPEQLERATQFVTPSPDAGAKPRRRSLLAKDPK